LAPLQPGSWDSNIDPVCIVASALWPTDVNAANTMRDWVALGQRNKRQVMAEFLAYVNQPEPQPAPCMDPYQAMMADYVLTDEYRRRQSRRAKQFVEDPLGWFLGSD
jgi:hypothetical protein